MIEFDVRLAGGAWQGRGVHLPQRSRAASTSCPAAGGTVEAIISEVLRRLAVTDEAGRDVVREACEDAAAG